jgi:serine/threonine protein phosphatase 1
MSYGKNENGNDYIIGDLHGHLSLIEEAMENVSFDKNQDRLFSTGDLIDRGPGSADCLQLIFEPWFYSVRGNHEQMMIDAIVHGDSRMMELWMFNGGSWFHDHNLNLMKCLAEEAEKKMPYWIELQSGNNKIGIVHAEPPSDWMAIGDTDKQALIWSRDRINKKDCSIVENIDVVYVGHTPLEQPIELGNVRYVDTGAFHTGNLTITQL